MTPAQAHTDRAGGATIQLSTSCLDVPGARLYYESYGVGPLMVMIPGAAGSAEPYRSIASHLASSYRVVIYDRRGFSRSPLVGDQDFGRRLETDADDVRDLVEHMGAGPGVLFGNSSGAIVALEVLIRHPSAVRLAVAHEPPIMTELADGDAWVRFFFSLYELYRKAGPGPALDRFREKCFPQSDRDAMAGVPENEFSAANAKYWFEHELRQYPSVNLDHAALTPSLNRLVLAVGHDSREYPCGRATLALGEKLGRTGVELPGGHVGFVARADVFASDLVEELSRLSL